MFLAPEELKTHIRLEHSAAIAGGDNAVIAAAITGAIVEAKGYLEDRFDTEAIFSQRADARHALLLIFVKDIAVYQLINMTNAGVNYEKKEKRYERAIKWLEDVNRGKGSWDLPLKKDPSGKPAPGLIYSSSNPKRGQHF